MTRQKTLLEWIVWIPINLRINGNSLSTLRHNELILSEIVSPLFGASRPLASFWILLLEVSSSTLVHPKMEDGECILGGRLSIVILWSS